MAVVNYGVMLLVAAAASVTDLRRGRIPNRLLGAGLAVSCLLQAWVWFSGASAGEDLATAGSARLAIVLLNSATGLAAGVLLYFAGLVSAGDGKLLFVLAVAQPAWEPIGGPVPWAPVLVVLGNSFVVALVFLLMELLFRGLPRLVRALKGGGGGFSRLALSSRGARAGRIILVVAALAAALSPLRQWAGGRAGDAVAGGAFFLFLALYVLYKPLILIAMRPWGLWVSLVVLVAALGVSVALHGAAGAAGVGRSLLVAAAVVVLRGVLGLSSWSFDGRRIDIDALEPGMVLSPPFLARLGADERWMHAFQPNVGDLRGVKLDANLIKNVREWHEHNAPDERVEVAAPLPFAPALCISVILTALTGQLLFRM